MVVHSEGDVALSLPVIDRPALLSGAGILPGGTRRGRFDGETRAGGISRRMCERPQQPGTVTGAVAREP